MRTMTNAARAYTWGIFEAAVGYAVLLPISIVVIQAHPDAWWRVPLALLPVLPVLLGVRVFLRFLGQMDELQRRIQLEALGFAFGWTALLTFSYGFLENAGLPQISWIWIFPFMIILWGIGLALASRKYN